jgi:uncharacterized Fe-S cluster protein YjdI
MVGGSVLGHVGEQGDSRQVPGPHIPHGVPSRRARSGPRRRSPQTFLLGRQPRPLVRLQERCLRHIERPAIIRLCPSGVYNTTSRMDITSLRLQCMNPDPNPDHRTLKSFRRRRCDAHLLCRYLRMFTQLRGLGLGHVESPKFVKLFPWLQRDGADDKEFINLCPSGAPNMLQQDALAKLGRCNIHGF